MEQIYSMLGISAEVEAFGNAVLKDLKERFEKIDAVAEYNQAKVLRAMQEERVDGTCFAGSTGYGYNDNGRDKLEKVYARCFGTEAALVRPQITCGTHALAIALSANLLPGDELLSPVGKPYDTLENVIGTVPSACSLMEYGVSYRQVELMEDGTFDYPAIREAINEKTKLVTIQRSKGYAMRPTFSVKQIGELIAFIKEIKPDVICMVDNCYGEFIEKQEPTEVGADLMAGSLIKNLGGGLAPTGGYIVGRADLVENASYRLTAPGLGGEMGATLGDTAREFYQGLFLAPHIVVQAVKTAIFAAAVFKGLGYDVKPLPEERRSDIIQAITLESKQRLCDFCVAIQGNSPVDAHVEPVPSPLPGYQDEIIMAAGTFVQGASIELSADGPCREPFNVFFQGGLTFEHGRLAIMAAAKRVGPKEA